MVTINEITDTIIVRNPHDGSVMQTMIGKQIGANAFVSFSQHGIYWAWTLHEFDKDINNGEVAPNSGRNVVVDPKGFIYNDEIYKIMVTVQ